MHTDRKKPEVSTAIILEKRVKNKVGKHPVKLRITYKRKRKYYTIKAENYSEKEFEAIYNPKSKGRNKDKRIKFDNIEQKAINIIDNVLKDFSFESFDTEYRNRRFNQSIQDYFNTKIKESYNSEKIQTAILYESTLNSLTQFDKNITIEKITPQFLKKYEKWMIDKDNSYTTIGIYLRNLKHIINRAMKDGIISNYPFGRDKDKYAIPRGKNTKKALNLDEVAKLYRYETNDINEKLALQYWFFSYLCNGMNMIDIANLRYKNIQRNNLVFIRQKTKDTSIEKPIITIYLSFEIQKLIDFLGNEDKSQDNYIFPIFENGMTELDRYKKIKQHIKFVNKYVQIVARKIGIDDSITTYWARHTYSTVLKRSGVSIEFIGESLGHQSRKVTQNYLDSFEDEHREKFSKQLLAFRDKKSKEGDK